MKPLRLMAWAIDTGEGYDAGRSDCALAAYQSRRAARVRLRELKTCSYYSRARVVRISIRIEAQK